ncbi:uncharacterized protein LOC142571089 [Dermacentor variabilis]|uniref:uncharacterized protein LOC142571089 n=1 Tax=Dermacentor variabilis TaxID=34621 RepID=UPI003F5BE22A
MRCRGDRSRSARSVAAPVAVACVALLVLASSPLSRAEAMTAEDGGSATTAPSYGNRTLLGGSPVRQQPANRGALMATALPATLGLGGILYGLTVLPALLALFGSGGAFPLTGFLGSLFREKSMRRSTSADGASAKKDSGSLLAVLQEALQRWDGASEPCRSMFVCQVAKEALGAGYLPDMRPFDGLFQLFLGDYGKSASTSKDAKAMFPHQAFFHAMRDGFRGCKAKYDCDAPLQPPRYPRTRKP